MRGRLRIVIPTRRKILGLAVDRSRKEDGKVGKIDWAASFVRSEVWASQRDMLVDDPDLVTIYRDRARRWLAEARALPPLPLP